LKGVLSLLESIKIKWSSSNISGIYLNQTLQIFDGRHRLTALQLLSKQEFDEIFGVKGNDAAGGVRVNIYKDFDASILIYISQS
jgi:hypothetical protein